jgi:hypothetical protein
LLLTVDRIFCGTPYHFTQFNHIFTRRLKNRATPQNKGGDLDATVTAKFPYNYSHAQTHPIPDLALV